MTAVGRKADTKRIPGLRSNLDLFSHSRELLARTSRGEISRLLRVRPLNGQLAIRSRRDPNRAIPVSRIDRFSDR